MTAAAFANDNAAGEDGGFILTIRIAVTEQRDLRGMIEQSRKCLRYYVP